MRTALLFATALLLLIASCMASSHSESPSTAKTPNADITDLYAFRSYESGRENFLTIIMNAVPLQYPNAGPNYYSLSDNHFFEINIDNNGDGVEDFIYQFLYGNEMGGDVVSFLQPADDSPCADGTLVNATAHGGLTIEVSNKVGRNGSTSSNLTPIALKFVGQISEVYDPVLNWNEYYTLTLLTGNRTTNTAASVTGHLNTTQTVFAKPFDYVGEKTFGDSSAYEAYAQKHFWDVNIPNCIDTLTTPARVFVGQRAESFSLQLGKIFDLINMVPVALGTFPSPNENVGVAECDSNNELRNLNVGSFVLELPISCLTGGGSTTIGIWSTVRKMVHVGKAHVATTQISRLGQPLVNELVIGLKDKAIWSLTEPRNDLAAGFAPYVYYPSFPAIVNALFLAAVQSLTGAGPALTSLAPNVPRNDLVALFFSGVPGITYLSASNPLVEYLRINTSVEAVSSDAQNNLGVIGGDSAGYPNGRRPGDDIVDISLDVVMGRLCILGIGCAAADAPVGGVNFTDGSPQNSGQFLSAFPYLKTPHPGSVTNNAGNTCPDNDSDNNSNGGSDSSSNTGTGSGTATGSNGDGNSDGDNAQRVQAMIAANIYNLRKVILGH